MQTNIGSLRTQTALQPANTPVVIITDDPEIGKLNLKIVEFYPDAAASRGGMQVFKVKVARQR